MEDQPSLHHKFQQLRSDTEQLRGARGSSFPQNDEFWTLYESAPVGCLTLDADARISRINRMALALVGAERSSALATPFGQFISQEHRECFEQALAGASETGDGRHIDVELAPGAESTQSAWIHLDVQAQRDPSGNVLDGWRVAATDVSELKHTEEKLKRSENQLKTIFNSARDAMFIVDVEGNFLEVNDTACRELGYSREELLAMGPKDITDIEHIDTLYHTIQKLKEQEDTSFEAKHVTKEGHGFPVEVTVRATQYAGVPAMVAIARDVTDRKESERLREEIDRITRHELKTPLNGVIGGAQLLRYDEALSEEARENATIVEESGKRMLHMIDDSLSLYKIETGRYQLTPERVVMEELLEDVKWDFRNEFERDEITLRIESGDGEASHSRDHAVEAEFMLSCSLFAHLLKNALEASERGDTIRVTVTRPNPQWVATAVWNRNPIPDRIRPRFGKKYVTADKNSGTGLGVYTARLMTEVQEGRFDWSSSKEEGTTITVFLPAAE